MSDAMVRLFRHLTSGVYVIGVADGERRNAFTASSLVQVSFSPLLVALSISPAHESYKILNDGRVFSINVLGVHQQTLAAHFGTQSARTVDKLATIRWQAGKTSAPLLSDALAHFECQLVNDIVAGDHHLVIGRVLDGAMIGHDEPPLIYAQTRNLDKSADLFPDTFS